MDFLETLNKSAGALPTPSATTPTPGVATGSSGSPRAGHKYVKRTWSGDHWDYEYAGEAHQNHGIQHTDKDEHTLAIPDSVGADKHERAQAGSKDALKDIYKESRQKAGDLESGEREHVGVHPVTGHPAKYVVGPDAASPTGYRIKVFPAVMGEDGKQATMKNGKPRWEKQAYGGTDWDKVQKWQKMAPHSEEIKGADGKVHYVVSPVSGEFDEETNQPKPAKDGRNYRIKITEHAPERGLLGDRGEIRVKDKDEAKVRLDAVRSGHARMQEDQATKQPASAHMQAGMSATDVLEGGHLPAHVSGGSGRVQNKFQSDEEKDAFIQQLASEKADKIREWAEKRGQPLDGDLEDITADKDSTLYRALDTVARNYQHKDGRSVDGHVISTIEHMNNHGFRTKNDKGESMRTQGVASAAMPLDSSTPAGKAAEAASAGVLPAKQGGGSKAAEDTENDLLDAIDLKNSILDKYKNAQAYKLDEFGKEYKTNKDVQDLIAHLHNELKSSRDPFDYHDRMSAGLKNMELGHVAPMILVHPGDLEKSLAKSFCPRNDVLVDFCKSYSEAYAISHLRMEEDLIKAEQLPQDDYSHSDGGLYPKFYYKDARGNQIRYTNAPDGAPDASGHFGPAARHPGEPDMAKNPEFFTPDGRKLSRAPYPETKVQWNQSYHPDDPENLWAGRWVNPVTGQHEYTYIEADLLGNDKLRIHRQNVVVDARLPVLRKYVAALFVSPNLKDKVTGLMLALLDQGKFRIRELVGLCVGDVRPSGDITLVGNRKIMTDYASRNILALITSGRPPLDPLFAVPRVGIDGAVDYSSMRRLGPHYIVNILEEIGIPLQALATYHASQTYSVEIQRMFEQHNISYNAAHTFAMLEVASEMGHNLDHVEDFEEAIAVLSNSIVDPIVLNVIKQNVNELGIGSGDDFLKRPVHQSVYQVAGTLNDLTPDEKLFSQWLHTVPSHNYIQ